MSIATTVADAQAQLSSSAMEAMVKSILIPPRPVVVHQLQSELSKDEPDIRRAAQIVGQDVGLTVAVLKTVNSPVFGLSRRAESLDQAVGLIGLRQLTALVAALSLRNLLRGDANTLERFHDTSSKRSYAMSRMAKETGLVDVGLAHTFGLFCDVGIPLLRARFPGYMETLKIANTDPDRSFTEVENSLHNTDHALVGALMAKSWQLPETVALAIRLHHDYAAFMDPKVPRDVGRLMAMGLVAEVAIQGFARMHSTVEWSKGGDYVAGALVLAPAEVEDWIEQLIGEFSLGMY